MNDFLQSLRGGQKDKRTPKTRRGFDNNNQYNANQTFNSHVPYQGTRGGNMKRPVTRASVQPHAPMETSPAPFSPPELAESVNSLVELLSTSGKAFLTVQERRVIAEERKAIAMEEIAEYLRVIAMPPLRDEMDGYGEPIMDEDSDDEANSPDEQISSREQYAGGGSRVKSYRDGDHDEIELTVELEVDDEPDAPRRSGPVNRKPEIRIPEGRNKNDAEGRRQNPDGRETGSLPDPVGNRSVVRRPVSRQSFHGESTGNGFGKDEIKVIKRKKADKADKAEKTTMGESGRSDELLSREEVMKIVCDMRAKGATFDQVAQHLVELGQPTFSGRGEWHAQTVHRLCNRRKK